LQTLLRAVYPPRCIACGALVAEEFALCASCWPTMPFILGLSCDLCGVPLPGETEAGTVHCDDCLAIARPWERGRAALVYGDGARRFVLALKHGDRPELARPAARWLAQAGAALLPGAVLVPVPLHWWRRIARRYNQSAELARALSALSGAPYLPGLLQRRRSTPPLDGHGRDARFAVLSDAIAPASRATERLKGRPVVLVDDVMTSGATLAAAAEAARQAGAASVSVLVLARVAKEA
jgi:predicted amidophosphoribosyltransferase